MSVVEFNASHVEPVSAFMNRLTEQDLTFIKESLDTASISSWPSQPGRRWLYLTSDGAVAGFIAVIPLSYWSSHVGEVRLVVDPAHRRQGVGRVLTQHAMQQALLAGQSKLVVEVIAEQQAAIGMFADLGFEGEALLRDHIRDRSGYTRDVIVLAHHVEDNWSSMASLGLAETTGAE